MDLSELRGRLLSKQAAAAFQDSSLSWVDRLIRNGQIKAVRLSSKMTRVDGDSLADYLESRANIPSTPRGKARGARS